MFFNKLKLNSLCVDPFKTEKTEMLFFLYLFLVCCVFGFTICGVCTTVWCGWPATNATWSQKSSTMLAGTFYVGPQLVCFIILISFSCEPAKKNLLHLVTVRIHSGDIRAHIEHDLPSESLLLVECDCCCCFFVGFFFSTGRTIHNLNCCVYSPLN